MPETSINTLRRQVKQLERDKARANEEAQLRKKIKQMQFQKTTFGKMTGGVMKFGESLTRPQQKDASGKVIAGTGGMGSKIVESLKRITAPKPVQQRQVMRRQVIMQQPMQQPTAQPSALDMFAGFGMPSQAQPTQRISKRSRKVAVQKPFDVNDIIRNLPQ